MQCIDKFNNSKSHKKIEMYLVEFYARVCRKMRNFAENIASKPNF